ncbi:MAG: 1-deoxy-D-xylulose-5-phosphate reductoisomerase [Clostridiales bacterium 43-6]|nr:MAG: 1-deoxy-D-xylulose-5-phosphate reductoisomerase [Clostridiales bacterium 43-6]
MKQKLSILGSTGSIGTQALNIARALQIEITALTAHSNIDCLETQIREFKPAIAVVAEETLAHVLKAKVADTGTKILSGQDGILEAATEPSCEIVLNALVGIAGLLPTMAAIHAKKDIALANKETLVAGGDIVMQAAKDNGVSILPVDSEHSAIFQCLQGAPPNNALSGIILTASGGPFFGFSREQLYSVKAKDALKHPNWNMGKKITIDCATMMNKGLEIIEAVHLFGLPVEKVDVVVHRESIIHSLIEYNDNSVIAQLGLPDMHIPIQYALTYPNRLPSPAGKLSLTKIKNFSFFEPDDETFLCLKTCKEAIQKGGLAPAAANGANEEAVQLFLEDKISFLDIGTLVYEAMKAQRHRDEITIEDVLRADRSARENVKANCK